MIDRASARITWSGFNKSSTRARQLVSVSDLTTYSYCKRKVWLLRIAKIQTGERDWESIVRYRLVRFISNLVDSKDKIHSLTDFMYETLHEVPGEIVDTENLLGKRKAVWKDRCH